MSKQQVFHNQKKIVIDQVRVLEVKEEIPKEIDLIYRVKYTGKLSRPFFDIGSRRLWRAGYSTKPHEFFLITIYNENQEPLATRGGTRIDARPEILLRN